MSAHIHFVRTHLPTGRVWHADFNYSHGACFGDAAGHSERWSTRVAINLVSGWNAQHKDTWRYELANGPAPAPG